MLLIITRVFEKILCFEKFVPGRSRCPLFLRHVRYTISLYLAFSSSLPYLHLQRCNSPTNSPFAVINDNELMRVITSNFSCLINNSRLKRARINSINRNLYFKSQMRVCFGSDLPFGRGKDRADFRAGRKKNSNRGKVERGRRSSGKGRGSFLVPIQNGH